MTKYNVVRLFILAAMLVVSIPAAAYSGYLKETQQFRNENGNYCDSSAQDCTGSYYPDSMFDTNLPISNARIDVVQGSSVIGQGSTDDNGLITVAWSSSDISTQARLRVYMQQKDGRFTVTNTSGQVLNNVTGYFTLVNGTTSGSPQNVGTWVIGSHSSPTWYANVYWAEEFEWRGTFALVSTLVDDYTGIEIRGVQANQPSFLGNCPTSCANGAQKRIQLDSTSSALSPQARILHESGHVVNYLENPFHFVGNYCWPNTSAPGYSGENPCGWAQGNPEWGSAAFEEGYATFSGDNTLWSPSAVAPTSCLSQLACPNNSSTNIEQRTIPTARIIAVSQVAIPRHVGRFLRCAFSGIFTTMSTIATTIRSQ